MSPRLTMAPPATTSNDGRLSGGRFLSREECVALSGRIAGMTQGGGYTTTLIESRWLGVLRFGRNTIRECSDIREPAVTVWRNIRAAEGEAKTNQIDDEALRSTVRRAERLLQFKPDRIDAAADVEYEERHLEPHIWSDATYGLDADARVAVAEGVTRAAEAAGMLAAGTIWTEARGSAVMTSRGRALYYPYTEAQYTVTVRDPDGTGSGWAGVSHYDWTKIDAEALTQRALDKCVRSRNPFAVEPGRYTVILEPQAVSDFFAPVFGEWLDRGMAESYTDQPDNPYWKRPGFSHLGDVIFDERLNVAMDPMDPELGHVPFTQTGKSDYPMLAAELEMYYPVQWIKNGRLVNLSTSRTYNIMKLGRNNSLRTLGAFRMWSSAPAASMDKMISTTRRGLVVTRFSGQVTRDGLWLVENGKITKAVKNMQFREWPHHCLTSTRLEQIGEPVRVFRPYAPILAPALKINDFNFASLVDAV